MSNRTFAYEKQHITLIPQGLVLPTFISVANPSPDYFVGSIKSHVYHYPGCHYVDRIKSENLIYFDTPEDAIATGYHPCKVCNPPISSASTPTPIPTPIPTSTPFPTPAVTSTPTITPTLTPSQYVWKYPLDSNKFGKFGIAEVMYGDTIDVEG